MSALAFDTHKAVIALKQAGFAEGQAEAVVNTMGEALDDNVATKADLTETRAALEAKMAVLKADLGADIAAVRTEMGALKADLGADIAAVRTEMAQEFKALYKQLWLMAVGIVGLTVTLLKLIS